MAWLMLRLLERMDSWAKSAFTLVLITDMVLLLEDGFTETFQDNLS
jgi:hypothetical protein